MAENHVVPIQDRKFDGDGNFLCFESPPVYRQTPDMPRLVVRGVLPIEYLEGDRFSGCTEPSHVRDILLVEGEYARPETEEWRVIYDRRIRAARARVKKKRQRA